MFYVVAFGSLVRWAFDPSRSIGIGHHDFEFWPISDDYVYSTKSCHHHQLELTSLHKVLKH